MYAVEEFGKAILLGEYFTGNKEKYQIPGWIFGHGRLTIESISDDPILKKLLLKQLVGKSGLKINAHDAKLLIGSNNLPPECSMITRGIRISTPIPSQIIDLKSDRRIFILEGVPGSFTDKTHIFFDIEKSTFIELELKTSCFYMDFDRDNKTWKYDISPDEKQLKENLKRFEKRLDKFNCN